MGENLAVGGEEPLLTRPFVLLTVAHFIQALGYSSMLLLPLYLDHLEASRTEIGAMMAASAIGGMAVRPVIGWALDALGRKLTVTVGTLITVAGMGMLALVDEVGPLIYVERVVFGIGVATLFTGYFTFAADLIPSSRRTEGIALFGVSGLVPMVINPFSSQIGIAPSDLQWFLPVVGLLILLSLPPLLPLDEPLEGHQEGEKLELGRVVRALLARRLWSVWLATVVFSGLVAVYMAFGTVAAEHQGVEEPRQIWLMYASGAVFVRIFGARLPDRVGTSNMVAPALGVFSAGVLVTALAHDQAGFMWGGLLSGLGHGYCFPVLTSQVVSRSPDRSRGSALAFFTALWGLSELVVTPICGAVADAYSDAAMFALAASTSAVLLAIWAVLEHRLGGERALTSS